VDQSSPRYVSRRGRDRSLQRRFPIVDIFVPFRRYSRSKCDVVRNRAEKSMFFGTQIFWEDPNFWTTSDHVAKFRGYRPRDRGDLALNKKRKKKQQQNLRAAVALSQRAALKCRGILQPFIIPVTLSFGRYTFNIILRHSPGVTATLFCTVYSDHLQHPTSRWPPLATAYELCGPIQVGPQSS